MKRWSVVTAIAGLVLLLGPCLAQDAAKPIQVSAMVMAGMIVEKSMPRYPPEARDAQVTGAVVLSAIIGKDGLVESLQVVSGPEMLRGAALEAARQWAYKPYLLNGEPVEVETTITVNFNFAPSKPQSTPPS